MKKSMIVGLAFMLFMIPAASVAASEVVPGSENKMEEKAEGTIKIDGKFEDWIDMPLQEDVQGDSGRLSQDLKEVRFFAEDDNLYLYIERYPSNEPLVDWDLRVPIIGGTGNTYPNFFPWENQGIENSDDWGSSNVSTFRVSASYESWSKAMNVSIKLGDKQIDKYRFENIDKNGLVFEVSIPLKEVGLDGPEKSVSFNVASAIDQYHKEKIDWIYNEGPILVTKGPIFGALTPVIALAGFAGIGFIATKKKRLDDIDKKEII